MQTFLPNFLYKESARVLDNKRLGKQRVECLQILKVLRTGPIQNSLVPKGGSNIKTDYIKERLRGIITPQ